MNVDALTIGAICAELRATVLGGRVQHVHLPDEYGLALELYAAGGGPQGREGAQVSRGAAGCTPRRTPSGPACTSSQPGPRVRRTR